MSSIDTSYSESESDSYYYESSSSVVEEVTVWHTAVQPAVHNYRSETAPWQQARNPGGDTLIAISAPTYITSQPQEQKNFGNCPVCRVGIIQDEFSTCGVLLAIFLFPIGIICCYCMLEERCSHCGARF